MVVVLVCLVIASTILLGLVTTSIRSRQQLRREFQLEQTYWLLDAGVGAALEQCKQDPGFETLEIKVDESLKKYEGLVSIEVKGRTEEKISLLVTAKLQGNQETDSTTRRSRMIVFSIHQSNQKK